MELTFFIKISTLEKCLWLLSCSNPIYLGLQNNRSNIDNKTKTFKVIRLVGTWWKGGKTTLTHWWKYMENSQSYKINKQITTICSSNSISWHLSQELCSHQHYLQKAGSENNPSAHNRCVDKEILVDMHHETELSYRRWNLAFCHNLNG